jgi:hypothetical protein
MDWQERRHKRGIRYLVDTNGMDHLTNFDDLYMKRSLALNRIGLF